MSAASIFSLPYRRVLVLGVCLHAVLAVVPAVASGGGGGSGSGSTRSSDPSETSQSAPPDLTTCPKGQVWNVKKKACTRLRAGVLPDEELADYAFALAKADRYGEAIDVLDLLQDPNTAEALNYRGYATRKLGRTDEGIGYYLRSVALDPRYAQVREYLGEAYVIKGRIDLAEDQLATIKSLCGTGCEPYRDLSEAIERTPRI